MFVAQRELSVLDVNGALRKIKPGEEVPNFDSWNIHARRAHLNLQWVVEKQPEEIPEFDDENFHCAECPRVFKSAKALKLHDKSVHR